MLKKIMRYLSDPDYRFLTNAYHDLNHRMDDEKYLKKYFHAKMGYDLDLSNPRTFNEKLQWLKLHDRRPIYTTMVDKYEAKKHVASVIGDEHIIPTLGVWEHFDEIDFDTLPDQFVLKCTHDSGGLVIVRDKTKLDREAARQKIEKCLKTNYYLIGREWPYKNVQPRIIAEKFMIDDVIGELRDYKFFCFDGCVKFYKIDYNRFSEHRANYYLPDGQLLKFGEADFPPNFAKTIMPPASLPLMIEIAEKLSSGHIFIRIDLYEVNGTVYFGEFTFYPASGVGKIVPEVWDKIIGEWIHLHEDGFYGD